MDKHPLFCVCHQLLLQLISRSLLSPLNTGTLISCLIGNAAAIVPDQ